MSGPPGVLLDRGALDAVIALLRADGYRTVGPVVRSGVVGLGDLASTADMPEGVADEAEPGHYRLRDTGDLRLFAWAVGPQSWKREFFPPRLTLWRAHTGGDVSVQEERDEAPPLAVIGARPCDLAALAVLDGVLASGAHPDPSYRDRRRASFVVAVECVVPGGTCFCASMGTGPAATGGFDLCLIELDDDDGPRYLVRAGSARGEEVLARIDPAAAAEEGDWDARAQALADATAAMGRTLDTNGLPALLARNQDHPRWAEVASRCLACGNCTTVCPTCFCSSVEDTTDITGEVRRDRRWSSCFELDHSYLHGGPVRASTSSRYRQWITHKLSTWQDQFGTSGCVGCGRCLTWCPVGIDITVEAAAIRADDRGLDTAPAGAGTAEVTT
ncbi:MAG TPA: 4Fe-4S dicluster domain-containing protein [Acidimicrobiales bacterium]|nr:4Fe-4S dicluster domain-containing protein [Acidimicrobiales bacterium]